jgi:serine protease Do
MNFFEEKNDEFKNNCISNSEIAGNGYNGDNPPVKEQTKKKSRIRTYISLVLVTSVISSLVVGGSLYSIFSNELKKQNELMQQEGIVSSSQTGTDNVNAATVKADYSQESSVSEIAKKVGPSIIGIRMTVGSPQGFGSVQTAEGSGIIISQDGYIMTNYHVVEYADPKNQLSGNTTLEVFLPDKRQAEAKFIGGDSTNDLAVIKVDLTGLPVAELGDSTKLEVGDPVVAIGNPLGMEFAGSVTSGVVSALNREVDTEKTTMNLIQTDAAINPGNSGGALVNTQGQVIGINSIKIAQAGIEGLGFAIPINDAKPIVDQLMMFGYVKGRPLIGISGQEITETIAQQYDLPVGIYITEVTQGSGADVAGIQKDDILVSLDGKDVKSMEDVDAVKKAHKAGDTVSAGIVRQGVKKDLEITFSEEK